MIVVVESFVLFEFMACVPPSVAFPCSYKPYRWLSFIFIVTLHCALQNVAVLELSLLLDEGNAVVTFVQTFTSAGNLVLLNLVTENLT